LSYQCSCMGVWLGMRENMPPSMRLHFTGVSIIAIAFYCKNPSKGKRDTAPPTKMAISYKWDVVDSLMDPDDFYGIWYNSRYIKHSNGSLFIVGYGQIKNGIIVFKSQSLAIAIIQKELL